MRRLLRLEVKLVGARCSNRRELLLERRRHGAVDSAVLYESKGIGGLDSHGTQRTGVGSVGVAQV